jgi:hypothetical protein
MAAPAIHAPSVATTGAATAAAPAILSDTDSMNAMDAMDSHAYVPGVHNVQNAPNVHGLPSAPEAAMISLWPSRFIGPEYLPMLEDVARMVCIQITIQLMFYLNGGAQEFFTPDFVMLVMYIVLGVMLYWLVFRRVIALH